MSSMGSDLSATVPQRSHLTSLCNSPAKVEWIMQMHCSDVDPLDVAWIWLRAVMKYSCASCCAYPDSSEETLHVLASRSMGPYGAAFSE